MFFNDTIYYAICKENTVKDYTSSVKIILVFEFDIGTEPLNP